MDAVDHYCERTDPGIWAEPLNALTNLAFIIAAWLLWHDVGTIKEVKELSTPEDRRTIAISFKIEGDETPVFIFRLSFFGSILQQMAQVLKFAESRSNLAIQGVRSFLEPSQTRARARRMEAL